MPAVCFVNQHVLVRRESHVCFCAKRLFALLDLACSSQFWKQMQSIFASVSLEETSYLKEQVETKIYEKVQLYLLNFPLHCKQPLTHFLQYFCFSLS